MIAYFATLDAGMSGAVSLPGIETRFVFWRGASGQRYLFTEAEPAALGHFRDVVVLIAERRPDGCLAGRSLAVVEGPMPEGLAAVGSGDGLVALVHFLAATPRARCDVYHDLTGTMPYLAEAAA